MPTLPNNRCSNCGAACVGRDALPSCNRCLPVVRAKRIARDKGGWPQCLVTIARVERWVAYDRAAAIGSNS